MDFGGKKSEYFMHNKRMPFFINSLVSINELWQKQFMSGSQKSNTIGTFLLEPYWPWSTGKIQEQSCQLMLADFQDCESSVQNKAGYSSLLQSVWKLKSSSVFQILV